MSVIDSERPGSSRALDPSAEVLKTLVALSDGGDSEPLRVASGRTEAGVVFRRVTYGGVAMLRCELAGLGRETPAATYAQALAEYDFMPDGAPGTFYTFFGWPEDAEGLAALATRIAEMAAKVYGLRQAPPAGPRA